MDNPSSLYPKEINLTNCDKEPIYLIGHEQDFGYLMALDKDVYTINFISENILDILPNSNKAISDLTIADFINETTLNKITSDISSEKSSQLTTTIDTKEYTLIYHLSGSQLLLELEQKVITTDIFKYQENLTLAMSELNAVEDEFSMCDKAAELIKNFYEYDRVMIYKFDAQWNGQVIAERKEDELESWLGLHYPATDIPQQARKLFLKQGVRIIENVSSKPVPIRSMGNATVLDLSRSETRSVSPIHIEYLENMKVNATLTAAIIFQDELWGLIACHNYSPKFINHFQRLSCKFITQVFSSQLGLRAANSLLKKVNTSTNVRSVLIEQMSQNWDIHAGLSGGKYTILNITEAHGAAICINNKITTVGITPNDQDIKALIEAFFNSEDSRVFRTSNLEGDFNKFATISDIASGVLGIFISKTRKDALLWFKPEVLQSVNWAGNPEKSIVQESNARISPRKSFEKWSQQRSGHSDSWKDYEIAAVKALKENISEIIIQKYDEITELNQKLKIAYKELESFSYSISHDLRSPLRGIDGYAQIIKEDYYATLDDYGKQAVETIISSTGKMNLLIDDILSFSGLGKKNTSITEFDMNQLVKEVLNYLHVKQTDNYPNINASQLPKIFGDRSIIFQLLTNLIGNAIKYSSRVSNPTIEISYVNDTFFVKDNGIGFDQKHHKKLFGIFSRLVNDDYEGSGIGLAVSHRIIEKHNGKIWAESEPDKGATFYFTLNTTNED
ncbi:ATP-binding protein [Aquimarina agarilytica]|uniref:ATP-binding protein n=1 Tax=Aquimarina agarilytica TaxID=1087449 RepID=UPI000289213E|nr:ATP-binding protein [Aquimarina agarilytica]